MSIHILAMNVAAPFLVVLWRVLARPPVKTTYAGWVWPASLTQIALLWSWHMPAPMAAAFAVPALQLLMHASLFAAALWFWRCVMEDAEEVRWKALGALLVTGKLFCLLGVLLAFAPRVLYPRAAELWTGSHHVAEGVLLPDQQLAGLIMLAVCPLTYVLAGVVIAARWLRDIERRDLTV
ncbi:cytochrome c oxidase assembly protein [Chelativorans sp. Marseille-P2723]|uniref:cytochrome c oxidase assembly protein n=1 Tax=Chelativorans sp. Marseille-P2723 TaxID=2709133 RepID=UPI001FEDDA6E|nr:cytochrome c oxidase assembly protein [Chelativorans sp. Marseille-P2723]